MFNASAMPPKDLQMKVQSESHFFMKILSQTLCFISAITSELPYLLISNFTLINISWCKYGRKLQIYGDTKFAKFVCL